MDAQIYPLLSFPQILGGFECWQTAYRLILWEPSSANRILLCQVDAAFQWVWLLFFFFFFQSGQLWRAMLLLELDEAMLQLNPNLTFPFTHSTSLSLTGNVLQCHPRKLPNVILHLRYISHLLLYLYLQIFWQCDFIPHGSFSWVFFHYISLYSSR